MSSASRGRNGGVGRGNWRGKGVQSGFQGNGYVLGGGARSCYFTRDSTDIHRDTGLDDGSVPNGGLLHGGAAGDKKCRNCLESGHLTRECSKRSRRVDAVANDRPIELVFGFKRLHDFLIEEPGNVIMAIGRNISEWSQLIDSLPNKTDEFFTLILHLLGTKVCEMDDILAGNRIEIVTNTFHKTFTERIQKTYGNMSMCEPAVRNGQRTVDQSRVSVLQSLRAIFTFTAYRCPSLTTDFVQNLLPGALGVLMTMTMLAPSPAVTDLTENYKELIETVSTLRTKANAETLTRKRFDKYELTESEEAAMHDLAPPDDFREMPITPTIEEIMSKEETFLRTNKKSGGYISADHYLDVQFRLLREDFVQPLKKGIQDFVKFQKDYLSRKKKMPLGNVRIYPGITINNVELIRDKMVYKIQLSADQYRRVKWEKSKRLLNGSLLVFTSDDFQSAHFATVASRDIPQLSKGILGISWETEVPSLDETFLMVECEVYFEAYRYTLSILKKLDLDTFPLAKFIVQGSDIVGAPAYMEAIQETMLIGQRSISPLELPGIPWVGMGLNFDDNQLQAFQAAITKEFSIIQGPPGTGKTYLGLKIAETFLQNWDVWTKDDKDCPILIVCYTNHALDQFLEGILDIMVRLDPKKEPALVRVGGRSKCERLDLFSLAKRRVTATRFKQFPREYAQSKFAAIGDVQVLEGQRDSAMGEAVGLSNLQGLVNFKGLACYEKIKEKVPEAILAMLEQPVWYGLEDHELKKENFLALEFIQRWFKTALPIIQMCPTPNPPVARQQTNDEQEEDDDEDYDVEELLSNRLVDDDGLLYEVSKRQPAKETSVSYLPGWSMSDCQNTIRTNRNALTALDPKGLGQMSGKEWREHRKKTDALETALLFAVNRLKFLETFFQLYKEGSLNFPNMGHYTEPGIDLSRYPIRALYPAQKWAIYFTVVEKARKLALEATSKINTSLMAAQKKLDAIRRYGDGLLLRETKVVGMTTTGAAKYNDFLQMMKSKIIIVEEAAEVLESHIVTCITVHCQQLILIGDHQQLRPSTTVYDLSTKYFLDISLFERMLNNNLNCYRLRVQHRMRPDIADLVVGTIYKELDNAPNVYDYPEVDGMQRSLYFLDHQEHEKSEPDSMSKSNTYEAQFLAHLCRHLILQGYEPSEITVLTTYTGQMFLLKSEIRGFPTCDGVRVTVVDNYQGEENKIILLSLVRSNEENNIGFLRTDNRICVAISRAKHGLYICGNMTNLTAKSDTWKQIKEKLIRRQQIGGEIKLLCRIHNTLTEIREPNDFTAKSPDGGCDQLCNTELACSHVCDRVCHSADRAHGQAYGCLKRCLKICNNNHQCSARCALACPPCAVSVEKTLPCQHTKKVECHLDPVLVQCAELVEKEKPCGHSEIFPCYFDPARRRCVEKVEKFLACGHSRTVDCHVDADSIQCRVIVTKTLVPCGHAQEAECRFHPEMIKCDAEVEKEFKECKHTVKVKCKDKYDTKIYCKVACPDRLECGHQCRRLCHPDSDPLHFNYKCTKNCARECENGHFCKPMHLCHQDCPPCQAFVDKVVSCGTHKKILPCRVPIGSVECQEPCAQKLPGCNHPCLKKCCEDCGPCQTKVTKRAPCGHDRLTKCSEEATSTGCEERVRSKVRSLCGHGTEVPCHLKDSVTPAQVLKYCQHPCGYRFEPPPGDEKACNHLCKGTCSGCAQGRLHQRCQEDCGRQLFCGHVCTAPCASACPPCRKPCLMKCEHSECKTNCGQPCTDCKEKCTWKCAHKQCTKLCSEPCNRESCDEPCPKKLKCGHACIGFCGEPCPPKCRVCDETEVTDLFFGTEDDSDARFVYLDECRHFFEADAFTYFMNQEIEEGEVGAKTCPKCRIIIRHTKRFGTILKARLKDLMAVKKRVFGYQEIVKVKQTIIVGEVQKEQATISKMDAISPGIKTYLLESLLVRMPTSDDKKYHYRPIPYVVMQCLEWIWKQTQDVAKVLKDVENGLRDADLASLKLKYGRIFDELMVRSLPLTNTEMENFEAEFDRHYDMVELYKRKKHVLQVHRPMENDVYAQARALINIPRPYTKQDKERLQGYLKDLDDMLKTGLQISDRERREIVAALGLAAGRFFKCKKGHYYQIGDCGGAMVEAKCSECDERIGGANHVVRSDNQFAPEIDEATRPLWG